MMTFYTHTFPAAPLTLRPGRLCRHSGSAVFSPLSQFRQVNVFSPSKMVSFGLDVMELSGRAAEKFSLTADLLLSNTTVSPTNANKLWLWRSQVR